MRYRCRYIPPAPARETDRLSATFVSNLVLLLVLGLLLSWWIWYYTDLFEAFGGLLALGGLLSWLGFVSRVLPESRLKAIQDGFDRNFMNNGIATGVLVALIAAGILTASLLGSVQLESGGESADRFVTITANGRKPVTLRLPAGGRVRVLIRTPADLNIKVSGYPSRTAPLSSWSRLAVRVPDSLLRPVILLRPTAGFLNMTRNYKDLSIRISSEGGILYQAPLTGTALWIGCDEDVLVPAEIISRWKSEVDDPVKLHLWSYPRSAGDLSKELPTGGTLLVEILKPERKDPIITRNLEVRPLERKTDYPQVEELDVPH